MKLNWKTIFIILCIAAVAVAVYFNWKKQEQFEDPLDRMTLNEAAVEGEMTEMKLLVQIKTPVGRADDADARLERGDVVLAKPADWQFSDTEKEIFLIVKVKMTPTLASLIVKPVEKKVGTDKETGMPLKESIKRRKFAVDLSKIGISENDEQGREITDKTFDWEVLMQK